MFAHLVGPYVVTVVTHPYMHVSTLSLHQSEWIDL